MARYHAIPAAVQAVLAGDVSRFGEIVVAFDAPVRRVVSRRLRDAHAREDVIQEVWIRVYQRLSALLEASTPEAWIRGIARNCAVDHHRRRQQLQAFGPLTHDVPDDAPASWVWDLVDTLPPARRELLTWRYRHALSYAEIAERLGVPASTVRGRMYDARQELRRMLQQRETT
ncbi:MAG: sigma-70 family RNA polymerase sigma factor [Planctomycetota bacterium]